jgi:hypothetical protein
MESGTKTLDFFERLGDVCADIVVTPKPWSHRVLLDVSWTPLFKSALFRKAFMQLRSTPVPLSFSLIDHDNPDDSGAPEVTHRAAKLLYRT